ncbi:MAG TPA: co-chaperone GroES [Candidatus Omnitrophica bacterium]|nr:co-chaperone GroES [Candidatus Omnitrophota bacterium]
MKIISPMNKRVIVEPQTRETKTPGGLYIPEIANQKAPTKGIIISIAADSDVNVLVQPGDTVLFSKFSGTEITLVADKPGEKDRNLLVMKDDEILAVIKDRQ